MAKTIELKIYGLTCDDCVRHVSGGLKNAKGVNDVSLSLKDGIAIVKTGNETKPEDLLNLEVFKGKYKAQLRDVKNE
ncbi:cation transporter [Ferroplasma sp.]|uniref:cation transporter n=1 Tax=Ferroplasma sp. TaxID=2591003 RepID=UPI00307D69BF